MNLAKEWKQLHESCFYEDISLRCISDLSKICNEILYFVITNGGDEHLTVVKKKSTP